jgi:hypothetical protein
MQHERMMEAKMLQAAASIFEPVWQTPIALFETLSVAGAGTAMFAGLVLVAALEFLRASQGAFVWPARVIAVAASALFAASMVYGDFLAAPARAAHSVIAVNESAHPTLLATSFGSVMVGAAYRAGKHARTSEPLRRPVRTPRKEDLAAVSAAARTQVLDVATRLRLQQLARNAPKREAARMGRSRLTHAQRLVLQRFAHATGRA